MMNGKKLMMLVMAMVCFVLLFAGCYSAVTTPDAKSIEELDRAKITSISVALKQDGDLAPENIKVEVVNQEATLSGSVATQEIKDKAGKIALGIEGIKKVNNILKVRDEAK
ncbi:MAG: BON domain-containing protein [Firmicutes bacterium]|nr:BON domain-containing protein [Bacillota bacterium]